MISDNRLTRLQVVLEGGGALDPVDLPADHHGQVGVGNGDAVSEKGTVKILHVFYTFKHGLHPLTSRDIS